MKSSKESLLHSILRIIEMLSIIQHTMILELNDAYNKYETDPSITHSIIRGKNNTFCTGLDFNSIINEKNILDNEASKQYMLLLKRLAMSPLMIITDIDGVAMTGGVGIVDTSDIAIASPVRQFTLTEAMWRLLPSNLMPHLIRRTGFQKAYLMTLTTQTLSAQEAKQINLINEVTDQSDE